MEQPNTATKLVEKISKEILVDEKLMDFLRQGNLYDFELSVRDFCTELFNMTMSVVLPEAAHQVCEALKETYKASGFRKLEERPVSIELHSGHRVTVPGLYAKSVAEGTTGSRHLLIRHWSISSGCSPLRVSQVGMCSALCPSYDIGNELIKMFGPVQCVSRVRTITQGLSEWCAPHEVALSLAKGESLAGKRVVISLDGGRTRTKCHKGGAGAEKEADRRKLAYDTPWCEPKLFVIQILDDKGEIERKNLPIYGVRFGEEDVLDLLRSYLRSLKIEEAQAVQIVADGAPWIWNNLQSLLVEAGVPVERITETLDYAHASGYVNKIIAKLSRRVSERKKRALLKQFLTWLWEGDAMKIVEQCKELFKRPSQELQRWINYLTKHNDRTQYAHYKENKWLCGSGIVESGIRRIINLRFKNPSTFWYKENVENLFFLRALCLSKRWDIFIKNFVRIEYD